MKEKMLFIFAVGVSIFLLFFVITCSWIGFDVKKQCQQAVREYRGSCTEALSSLLDDEAKDFRARNSAVWALGQLGDSRSLPVLQKYYTGNIPPREPLGQSISQYELKKAIKLAEGGLNISAFVWRWGIQ